MSAQNRRLRTRLAWSTAVAVGAVVGASVMVPSYGGAGAGESKALLKAYEKVSRTAAGTTEGDGLGGASDGHGHVHDPARKNDLSQSDEAGDTTDPTTPQEAEQAVEAVEEQRAEPDPVLTKVPAMPERLAVPKSRYAMAGGCYAVRPVGGGWVVRSGDGYAATGKKLGAAEPFHFQAATLGEYLLFDSEEEFVAPGAPATSAPAADESSIWTVTRKGGKRYAFASGGRLYVDASSAPAAEVAGAPGCTNSSSESNRRYSPRIAAWKWNGSAAPSFLPVAA